MVRITMRTAILPFAGLALLGAAPPSEQLDQPSYEAPGKAWRDVDSAQAERACRDRIAQVRADAGKPRLDRRLADPEAPILHYAVDRRVDGCGVLVPVGAPGEMLPPPEPGPLVILPGKPRL